MKVREEVLLALAIERGLSEGLVSAAELDKDGFTLEKLVPHLHSCIWRELSVWFELPHDPQKEG